MAKSKRISQEQIPDMVEELLPVVQKKIDMLQAIKEPTDQDARLAMVLLASLNTAYATYRVFKNEIKKEIGTLSQDRMSELLEHAKTIHQN